ncbi:MAG: hypothetical protein ABIQ86_07610 [Steroidobacteraceae bacterium]
MNQGKRYIRNTVLAMLGVPVLVAGATRIYASAVDVDSPQWVRSLMSLGLTVVASGDVESQANASQLVDLGDVLEFSRVEVEGMYTVEVVGAQQYKVSVTPAAGKAMNVGAEWNKGGLLRIKGGPDAAGAVLRIEAPTLTSIDARGVELLTVRALQAPVVSLRMRAVKAAQILESNGTWMMDAAGPIEVRMGNGTSSDINVSIKSNSRVTYSYGPKSKEMP